MDPLALLTRSAKRVKTQHRSTSSQLPSRGSNSNPQLFRSSAPKDQDASAATLKRKRDDATHGAEVDFFAPAAGPSAPTTVDSDAELLETADAIPAHESMPLDDRRKLFKEHKLKFSVLRSAAPAPVPKKKKKSAEPEKKSKHADAVYPEPVTGFAQLRARYGIFNVLARNIREQGFKFPTEVQMGALPLLLGGAKELDEEHGEGVDLLTIAPTGSGKTLAFLIPLIDALARGEREKGVKGVVLAPTKELVNQIVNEGRKLAVGLDLDIQAARKGVNLGFEEGKAVPDVIVATPLGLLHLLEEEAKVESKVEEVKEDEEEDEEDDVDASEKGVEEEAEDGDSDSEDEQPAKVVRSLSSAKYLVLDEADVLLDPLFKKQTLAVWEALNSPHLRISLWSATISSSVEADIRQAISDRHQSTASATPLVRLVVGLKDSAVPNISHRLTYCATEAGKLMALRELLSPKSASTETPLRAPFLVFTQTIPRATALHSELKFDVPVSAGGSSRIAVLHSDLPDRVRDKILTLFRKGEIWILITTDLLSRGVDFKGVNGVVNYDIPTSAAAYVHRCGRTGRAGREGGVAVTLYTKEDIQWVKIIANVVASADKTDVKQWLLDALPDVSKADRKKLKTQGVKERRRSEKSARITSKSGYVRREENRRREGMKKRA